MTDISNLITQALVEDIGSGDHSGAACIPTTAQGRAKLLAKDSGIIAGLAIAEEVFKQVDPSSKLSFFLKDGDFIKAGDIVFEVEGSSQSILKSERLALNFLQRMSGIASHTHRLTQLLDGLKTKVLDTRKTTPNFRPFEKLAVAIGGGVNHRFGLYDMIMIKDNHIDYAGGIQLAIDKTHQYLLDQELNLKIEVEARNLEEVDQILKAQKVDRIMLDNFNYSDLRKAVSRIGDYAETEASGGITEETIRDYAECGVDYISVGALTHQIKSLDLSLKAF